MFNFHPIRYSEIFDPDIVVDQKTNLVIKKSSSTVIGHIEKDTDQVRVYLHPVKTYYLDNGVFREKEENASVMQYFNAKNVMISARRVFLRVEPNVYYYLGDTSDLLDDTVGLKIPIIAERKATDNTDNGTDQ